LGPLVRRIERSIDRSCDTVRGVMQSLVVNGAELAYAEFGAGPTLVVSAQQDFAPGGFLETLVGPPTNYHVFAIRLRRLTKNAEGPGEDLNPALVLALGGGRLCGDSDAGSQSLHLYGSLAWRGDRMAPGR
jgi:hypothetical protein